MGYTTEFDGVLKFKHPLSVEQDAFLRTIVGNMEDSDDHPDWIKPKGYNGYIQLEISKDGSGIQWDGNEKFYDSVDAVNTVIMTMQAKFPDFGLTGELTAQGEDIKDRWFLAIGEDGFAYEKSIDLGAIYRCPHCSCDVILSEAKKVS